MYRRFYLSNNTKAWTFSFLEFFDLNISRRYLTNNWHTLFKTQNSFPFSRDFPDPDFSFSINLDTFLDKFLNPINLIKSDWAQCRRVWSSEVSKPSRAIALQVKGTHSYSYTIHFIALGRRVCLIQSI